MGRSHASLRDLLAMCLRAHSKRWKNNYKKINIVCDTTRAFWKFQKGGFFEFFFYFMYVIQHCFICRLSDCTVSEDNGIEPRTLALTARRSNHLARSHPHLARSHPRFLEVAVSNAYSSKFSGVLV